MQKTISIALTFLLAFIFACTPSKKQDDTMDENMEGLESMEDLPSEAASEITIEPLGESPMYPDAKLTFNMPDEGAVVEAGDVSFDFDVSNYELGVQTADAEDKMIANSGKGQHIHLILNNKPYSAHYEPDFNKEMKPGHYVALAFLSRSYHESVKGDNAYALKQFSVGEEQEQLDLSGEHLFYSRPKGTYSGADTARILFDFYLINTSISEDGNKVRLTVNGNEFMITEWKPYIVKGLPLGENTFKIELIDSEGNQVPGPFNVEERIVTLSK